MTKGTIRIAKARPLPVFILADTSGSMQGEKIQSLNIAIADMLSTFQKLEDYEVEVQFALITFGDEAEYVQELAPAKEVVLPELAASGVTMMGKAFELLSNLLEDQEVVPSRAYTPLVVLVSDGFPTDVSDELVNKFEEGSITRADFEDWDPLRALRLMPRSAKCTRLAISIGEDASNEMLRAFVNPPDIKIMQAQDARGIIEKIRWVTMTVVATSMSRDPNAPVIASDDDKDEEELEY